MLFILQYKSDIIGLFKEITSTTVLMICVKIWDKERRDLTRGGD